MTNPEPTPHMIFHDFENNSSGTTLEEWPLHFTVTPFFTLESMSQADALDLITDITAGSGAIFIEPGETAMYGPNNDIPVTKILDQDSADGTGELARLHNSLIRGLGEYGCKFTDLTYALRNYSPHISHKSSLRVPETTYRVNSISVATKLPKEIQRNKVILKRIDL